MSMSNEELDIRGERAAEYAHEHHGQNPQWAQLFADWFAERWPSENHVAAWDAWRAARDAAVPDYPMAT